MLFPVNKHMSNKSTIIPKEIENDKKDVQTIQKKKVTSDIKEYHKNYQQTEKWKEYFSTYLNENKDLLNKKKRDNSKVKKELKNIIKNCILQNTIFFTHIEDLDKCCNFTKIILPNSIKSKFLYKPP